MTYTKDDIDRIFSFFGLDYKEVNNAYVLRTVCHNHQDGIGSEKLFVYFNDESVVFHCYTNCGTMT